jgi:hypothetical protein
MRWYSNFVGTCLALTIGCNLLYALEKPTGKEIVHPTAGVGITPPNGWTGQIKEDPTSDVLFVMSSPTQDGTLTVSGSHETRRSIRGIWTGLRYSVVCDQGASILQDLPMKFGNMNGRQLVYQTYLSGRSQKTYHCCVGSQKYLFTAIYQGAAFEAQLPAIKGSITSLRWTTAKAQSPEVPDEEVETK